MPFLFAPVVLNVDAASAGQSKCPVIVKVGYAYLTDKDARNATSNNGYTVGVSYPVGQLVKSLPGTFALDLDFTNHTGNGNKIENWSLLGVYRAPLTESFYYGVGLGVNNTLVSDGTLGVSARPTTLGGVILVGSKISDKGSVELYYRLQNKVNGVTVNTLGLVYGMQF
jgi:hypothetical protein